MSRSIKILMSIVGLSLWGLILGFVFFANQVTGKPQRFSASADGIVVFTGEGIRIKEAARLLKEGRAGKLLISGVNPKIKASELGRVTGLSNKHFDCCVTLGYEAINTLGNANETFEWAQAHDLKSLIVVTSSYHMPRALAELSIAMPETALLSHVVLPTRFQKRAWWTHFDVTFVLVSEYLKFLPAAARVGVKNIQQAWVKDTNAHASMTAN